MARFCRIYCKFCLKPFDQFRRLYDLVQQLKFQKSSMFLKKNETYILDFQGTIYGARVKILNQNFEISALGITEKWLSFEMRTLQH